MIENPFYTSSMAGIYDFLNGISGWTFSSDVFSTAFSCVLVGMVSGCAVWLIAKAVIFIFSILKGGF